MGLTGFYTPKFRKLDFIPWSLVLLAIHLPWLIFVVSDTSSFWCVLFLTDQPQNYVVLVMTKQRAGMHKNYVVSRLNLKRNLPLNDTVSAKILKSKNKTSHDKKINSHKLKPHKSWTNHPSGTGGEGSNSGEPIGMIGSWLVRF